MVRSPVLQAITITAFDIYPFLFEEHPVDGSAGKG
jgi:hypothetical protein